MREKYESLSVVSLREVAKARGLRHLSGLKKSQLVDLMLQEDEKEANQSQAEAPAEKKEGQADKALNIGESRVEKSTQTEAKRGSEAPAERPVKAESRSGSEASAERPVKAESRSNSEAPAERPVKAESRSGSQAQAERPVQTESRSGSQAQAERPVQPQERRRVPVKAAFSEERRTLQKEGRYTAGHGEERSVQAREMKRVPVRDERGERTASAQEGRNERFERKPNRVITSDGIEIDNPELDSGISAHGILEVMPDGYGFIRCENYLPGDQDVYVSPSQIRKFGLKTGDIILGNTRVKTQQEKFSALLYIKNINGCHPSEILRRPNFEDLTPIFPNSRIRLETERSAVAMRIMDVVSPIGKGQRGMIVSPPKAGKTTLLKQVAKLLAVNTNYATMISAPTVHGNKLKFIQLSKVDVNQLLAVIVMEGNVIKNNILQVTEELSDENILKLNIMLNTYLNGLALEEINLALISSLKQQAGIHSGIIGDVIDAIAEGIKAGEDLEIYTSGANNIFKYPELADHHKASEIINTFEEKQMLTELVQESLADESSTGIQVYIGNETPIQAMKDCSVVTATYELGEGMRGTIGIIGPKRMDYDKVIGTLKRITHQLDDLYKDKK